MLMPLNKLFFIHKTICASNLVSVSLNNAIRCYCYKSNSKDYVKCYKILGIPNNSDQEAVRRNFIDLCKKYHPDSGSVSANAEKFQEIENAYRLLQHKFSSECWNVNEGIGEYGLYYKEKKKTDTETKPEVFDIKHTAPQHRQYLSFDGVGSGTPSQRQKQYTKYRTLVAAENVFNHHVNKISQNTSNSEHTLILKDKTEAKKIKTRYGMDRLVEDLIQESIAKGHFDNLKGQGKPLPPSNYNPYVDFVTHKMNEILIDNGFTPEWITLQKEIADEIELIKEILSRERKKLGSVPLNLLEESKWQKVVENLEKNAEIVNKKINQFNLVVPILDKQKLLFDLKKVSCDILNNGHFMKEHLTREEEVEDNKPLTQDVFTNVLSFFK